MIGLRSIFVLLGLIAFAASALAEKRVALVIGNAAYKHAPALANPKNDAEGVAASLRRLKFDVLEGTDLDKPAMERLLQAFSLKLETADVALVFYAGHGLQVHGRNYLVPVEAKLDREADFVFQAVPLDVIQGLMEQSQRTNIMILDACRDNPLARNLARTMGTRSASIGRGLGETKAGIGTLIVYATQPGNVALDGETKNSPFTAALLKHIEAPGLEIRQVLTRVRNDVITATREKQVPWDSSSLRGDFFFAAAPAAREAPGETKPPAATDTPPRGPAPDQETVFWQSIQNSTNAADFKDYLARWPAGTFAEIAKRRLAEIEKAAAVTPPVKADQPEKPSVVAPSPPAAVRTSTWLPDITVSYASHGITYLTNPPAIQAANARACMAACINDKRCVAWVYNLGTGPNCVRLAGSNPQTYPSPHKGTISGVIRTTPAAAPAQPAAPKPEPGAMPATPQLPAAIVRDLIRKAEAGEKDAAFCAALRWTDPTVKQINSFFERATVGAAWVGKRSWEPRRNGCWYTRVAHVGIFQGKRCALEVTWQCNGEGAVDGSGACKKSSTAWCRLEKGWMPNTSLSRCECG